MPFSFTALEPLAPAAAELTTRLELLALALVRADVAHIARRLVRVVVLGARNFALDRVVGVVQAVVEVLACELAGGGEAARVLPGETATLAALGPAFLECLGAAALGEVLARLVPLLGFLLCSLLLCRFAVLLLALLFNLLEVALHVGLVLLLLALLLLLLLGLERQTLLLTQLLLVELGHAVLVLLLEHADAQLLLLLLHVRHVCRPVARALVEEPAVVAEVLAGHRVVDGGDDRARVGRCGEGRVHDSRGCREVIVTRYIL